MEIISVLNFLRVVSQLLFPFGDALLDLLAVGAVCHGHLVQKQTGLQEAVQSDLLSCQDTPAPTTAK
jgi:hypothetical protein